MAKDRFDLPLQCPTCGRTGTARAEEQDGWAYAKGDKDTFISDLPDGFYIVDQRSRMASVNIYCSDCAVSAIG